jgi:hypothetical protein
LLQVAGEAQCALTISVTALSKFCALTMSTGCVSQNLLFSFHKVKAFAFRLYGHGDQLFPFGRFLSQDANRDENGKILESNVSRVAFQ